MVKTFQELQKGATGPEVVEALTYYADSGLGIAANVAKTIINSAGLSKSELSTCLEAAKRGQKLQQQLAGDIQDERQREPLQYKDVVACVERLLAA